MIEVRINQANLRKNASAGRAVAAPFLIVTPDGLRSGFELEFLAIPRFCDRAGVSIWLEVEALRLDGAEHRAP